MERWAANTLRILGIVLTSIVVVCGCLFLLLLSQCAASGGFGGNRNPSAATNYMFGAILLGVAGIAFIAWLSRSIYRSGRFSRPAQPASEQAPVKAQPSLRHLSAASQRAIDLLTWALAAQIGIAALTFVYTAIQFRQMPTMRHSRLSAFLIASIFFAAPYALLIYFLRRRLSRAVLSFAIGVPAASLISVLVISVPLISVYTRNPVNLAMLLIPVVVDVVIIVLAWQAEKQTGLLSPASSLLTTVVVSFVYFYAVHFIFQLVYRFVR